MSAFSWSRRCGGGVWPGIWAGDAAVSWAEPGILAHPHLQAGVAVLKSKCFFKTSLSVTTTFITFFAKNGLVYVRSMTMKRQSDDLCSPRKPLSYSTCSMTLYEDDMLHLDVRSCNILWVDGHSRRGEGGTTRTPSCCWTTWSLFRHVQNCHQYYIVHLPFTRVWFYSAFEMTRFYIRQQDLLVPVLFISLIYANNIGVTVY